MPATLRERAAATVITTVMVCFPLIVVGGIHFITAFSAENPVMELAVSILYLVNVVLSLTFALLLQTVCALFKRQTPGMRYAAIEIVSLEDLQPRRRSQFKRFLCWPIFSIPSIIDELFKKEDPGAPSLLDKVSGSSVVQIDLNDRA